MPNKGLSLHIGLNSVDPNHYGGWDGQLAACEFNAKDMQALAKTQGFTSQILLTPAATSTAVIAAIDNAAKTLKKGDIFFLSYSGHGGQLPDTNHEEPDRMDETWVLYDRELVDDELYALLGKFAAGVRVITLSDTRMVDWSGRRTPCNASKNTASPCSTQKSIHSPLFGRQIFGQRWEIF